MIRILITVRLRGAPFSMRTWIAAVTILTFTSASGMVDVPAQAQPLDSLRGAVGMGSSSQSTGSGLGSGLGGMSMPSVGSASSGNIAGLLRYCVRNHYENATGASSVENGLVGKLGGNTTRSSQFESGDKGILQTGNGQSASLGGGGLKGQMTQKVCDQVLKHAKSLI